MFIINQSNQVSIIKMGEFVNIQIGLKEEHNSILMILKEVEFVGILLMVVFNNILIVLKEGVFINNLVILIMAHINPTINIMEEEHFISNPIVNNPVVNIKEVEPTIILVNIEEAVVVNNFIDTVITDTILVIELEVCFDNNLLITKVQDYFDTNFNLENYLIDCSRELIRICLDRYFAGQEENLSLKVLKGEFSLLKKFK